MLLAEKVNLKSLKPKSKQRGKKPTSQAMSKASAAGFGTPAPQVLSAKEVGTNDPLESLQFDYGHW